jgi:hypothetical protein
MELYNSGYRTFIKLSKSPVGIWQLSRTKPIEIDVLKLIDHKWFREVAGFIRYAGGQISDRLEYL